MCYSTTVKTSDANNLNNDQQVEENISELSPQTKEVETKVNATGISYRNIKQKGPKRTSEKVTAKRGLNLKREAVRKDIVPKKQRKSEKRPDSSIRYNYSLGHLPHIDKSRYVRCKNEWCEQKTCVSCGVCDVHLCFSIIDNRNCFTDFHIEKK